MSELNDDQWQTIDAEIIHGRMITAIKLYREATGAGLKEAKDACERRLESNLNCRAGGSPVTNAAGAIVASPKIDWGSIDGQLFSNRKMSAIKAYRDLTGEGLKEAKEAVEAREGQLRISSPGQFTNSGKAGCLSVILIVIGLAIVWNSLT